MGNRTIMLGLGFILLAVVAKGQNTSYNLHYDAPASDYLADDPRNKAQAIGYIQEALPMGNGRLGAMFNGGVDSEHLVINEISAWTNTVRGRDEVSQSGVRKGSYQHLEKLQKATRDGQFGTGENAIETLATRYFGSHTRLGNYAPFTEIFIATGHDSSEVNNYQRTLDLRTGIGTVSYNIGKSKYKREYFCSYPNDVVAVRYTSEGKPLDLQIKTSTKHKTTIKTGFINRTTLVGEIPMVRDNMKFIQTIHAVVDNGTVTTSADGTISVRNAESVSLYIGGYTDYLPRIRPSKGVIMKWIVRIVYPKRSIWAMRK